jgi:hypothetical protein
MTVPDVVTTCLDPAGTVMDSHSPSRTLRITVALFAVSLFALTGCRGEQICAGAAASKGGGTVASCKLKKNKPYNVVLQAKDVRDLESPPGNDDNTGFDDWSASVEGKVLDPDGNVVAEFSGGTNDNEGQKEFESGSNETVTFGLESLKPTTAGSYEIVVESGEFGRRAPKGDLEVAILKDEWL